MSTKRLKRFLMSGADAQQLENILELFRRIKGRPATPQERDELSRRKLLPAKNGVPSLKPIGTGIGLILGGVATRSPKRPS
jgi:hypothetical protein